MDLRGKFDDPSCKEQFKYCIGTNPGILQHLVESKKFPDFLEELWFPLESLVVKNAETRALLFCESGTHRAPALGFVLVKLWESLGGQVSVSKKVFAMVGRHRLRKNKHNCHTTGHCRGEPHDAAVRQVGLQAVRDELRPAPQVPVDSA